MNAGFINQLMSCHWLAMGAEIESPGESEAAAEDMIEAIRKIRSRPKPQFDF